jgi:hypothetical protein
VFDRTANRFAQSPAHEPAYEQYLPVNMPLPSYRTKSNEVKQMPLSPHLLTRGYCIQ